MKCAIRRIARVGLLPCVLAGHGPVLASNPLEPVIVTATRFESELQQQPIAAQVITADEIRDSSASTIAEVLARLGGVQTRANFTGVADRPLDLRGFGMSGDQNTLVLVNGIRISENEGAAARLSAIPIESIEKIEILRGAGAVLYGGGATGGTINIITRSPLGQAPAAQASVTAGSHNTLDLRAGLQRGDDRWGLILNAGRFQSDNWRQNSRAEQEHAAGEIRLRVSQGFVALGFNADQQRARLPGALSAADITTDRRATRFPNDFVHSESQMVSLRTEQTLGTMTLALDLAHRTKDAEMLNDYRFGATDFDATTYATRVSVNSISPRALWKSTLVGAENRLTIGLDWSDWAYDNDIANNGLYAGEGYASTRDERGGQLNRAIYFRDELRWASGTRLSLGARREEIRQDQQFSATGPVVAAEYRLNAHELALQQPIARGLSVYGRAGESFRVANIDDNRCIYGPCPTQLLRPQQSVDRELGVQWNRRGLSLRASAFDIALENEIHFNGWTRTNMNLAPTSRRGFELEGLMSLGPAADLGLRYQRTTARFREGDYERTNFDGSKELIDLTGKEVPLVPRDRIGLTLGWQLAASTRLSANINHIGAQRYDNDQANRYQRMPAFTLTDLKLTHQMGAWRWAAGINNLFAERYYLYGIVNGSFTSFNAYPEDLRSAYVTASYQF
jgi:iron complex outermembrane receptor protein